MIRTLVVRTLASAALAAATAVATSGTAHAQSTVPAATTPSIHSNAQVVSANPFLLMYQYYNVEFERRATRSSTWGVSSSATGVDDADYRNLQAFYRYYPQNDAMSGFYVGGRFGGHRVSLDDEAAGFFGVGFEIGYNWLLGKERNFSVGMGAGATRLFGGSLDGVSLTIPTVRLVNLGWSF